MKKRSDGRYCKQVLIGYNSNGTRKMKTIYGKTIKEVEKKERDLRIEIENGNLILKNISVSDWADEWLITYKTADLSHYTVRRYESVIKNQIKPFLGHMKLNDVKLFHVQKLINNLSNYSSSSVKKVRDTLHQMYEAAIANELATKDPTVGLIINKKDSRIVKSLSDNEREQVIKFCKNTIFEPFIMTLLYTGMRRGEIVGLLWDDIDFESKVINVDKAVVFKENKPTISSPKTKNSIRKIPMINSLVNVLEKHKEKYMIEYGENLSKKPVFVNSLGNQHSESSIGKFWNKFIKEYNTHYGTTGRIGIHQFRHTYATLLYNAGVDIKTAQAVLGHADISITLRVYTHLEDKQMKYSVDKLNDYICNEYEV